MANLGSKVCGGVFSGELNCLSSPPIIRPGLMSSTIFVAAPLCPNCEKSQPSSVKSIVVVQAVLPRMTRMGRSSASLVCCLSASSSVSVLCLCGRLQPPGAVDVREGPGLILTTTTQITPTSTTSTIPSPPISVVRRLLHPRAPVGLKRHGPTQPTNITTHNNTTVHSLHYDPYRRSHPQTTHTPPIPTPTARPTDKTGNPPLVLSTPPRQRPRAPPRQSC